MAACIDVHTAQAAYSATADAGKQVPTANTSRDADTHWDNVGYLEADTSAVAGHKRLADDCTLAVAHHKVDDHTAVHYTCLLCPWAVGDAGTRRKVRQRMQAAGDEIAGIRRYIVMETGTDNDDRSQQWHQVV